MRLRINPSLKFLLAILGLQFFLAAITALGHGGDPVKVDAQSEQLIKGALRFLAKHQSPNGSWQGLDGKERLYPIANTAYALIAFQACGHLPDEGEYGANVRRGMTYLLKSVSDEGLIGNQQSGQYMYFHGIATIALAELYGQTSNRQVKPKLSRLIKVIVSTQNNEGGWRYRPIVYDADISVTVLQVVALRAAKNGGLNVPQKTIDNAVDYVRKCYSEEEKGFAYQPGGKPGFARTAAAIYSLQVCGKYDDPLVKAGSRYLFKKFSRGERWFTYGNYYAAPAHYMIGGETWKRWYELIGATLKKKAKQDGELTYWSGDIGRIYSTAAHATILAMPYHYLPLYQR